MFVNKTKDGDEMFDKTPDSWNNNGYFIQTPISVKKIVEGDRIAWVHKTPNKEITVRAIGLVRDIEFSIDYNDTIKIEILNVQSEIKDFEIEDIIKVKMDELFRHPVLREAWQDNHARSFALLKKKHAREIMDHHYYKDTFDMHNPPDMGWKKEN